MQKPNMNQQTFWPGHQGADSCNDLPNLDWDVTYDPALLLPHGLSLNTTLYTRAETPEEVNQVLGVSDSDEILPSVEEDSWWYSDAYAPESKYEEWYLSSGDWVSKRPRSRRYRGAFNPKSGLQKTQRRGSRPGPPVAQEPERCGDDDEDDFASVRNSDSEDEDGFLSAIPDSDTSSEVSFRSCLLDLDTEAEVEDIEEPNTEVPVAPAPAARLAAVPPAAKGSRSILTPRLYHQVPRERVAFFKNAESGVTENENSLAQEQPSFSVNTGDKLLTRPKSIQSEHAKHSASDKTLESISVSPKSLEHISRKPARRVSRPQASAGTLDSDIIQAKAEYLKAVSQAKADYLKSVSKVSTKAYASESIKPLERFGNSVPGSLPLVNVASVCNGFGNSVTSVPSALSSEVVSVASGFRNGATSALGSLSSVNAASGTKGLKNNVTPVPGSLNSVISAGVKSEFGISVTSVPSSISSEKKASMTTGIGHGPTSVPSLSSSVKPASVTDRFGSSVTSRPSSVGSVKVTCVTNGMGHGVISIPSSSSSMKMTSVTNGMGHGVTSVRSSLSSMKITSVTNGMGHGVTFVPGSVSILQSESVASGFRAGVASIPSSLSTVKSASKAGELRCSVTSVPGSLRSVKVESVTNGIEHAVTSVPSSLRSVKVASLTNGIEQGVTSSPGSLSSVKVASVTKGLGNIVTSGSASTAQEQPNCSGKSSNKFIASPRNSEHSTKAKPRKVTVAEALLTLCKPPGDGLDSHLLKAAAALSEEPTDSVEIIYPANPMRDADSEPVFSDDGFPPQPVRSLFQEIYGNAPEWNKPSENVSPKKSWYHTNSKSASRLRPYPAQVSASELNPDLLQAKPDSLKALSRTSNKGSLRSAKVACVASGLGNDVTSVPDSLSSLNMSRVAKEWQGVMSVSGSAGSVKVASVEDDFNGLSFPPGASSPVTVSSVTNELNSPDSVPGSLSPVKLATAASVLETELTSGHAERVMVQTPKRSRIPRYTFERKTTNESPKIDFLDQAKSPKTELTPSRPNPTRKPVSFIPVRTTGSSSKYAKTKAPLSPTLPSKVTFTNTTPRINQPPSTKGVNRFGFQTVKNLPLQPNQNYYKL